MKIALLGDIALFGRLSYKSSKDIDYYFEEVASFLGTMDYVVGNLETPFSVKKKTSGAKSAYICSDIENIKILKSLHINAVSLANNHMFDFGKEGYEVTKRVLHENGIEWFGSEGKEFVIEKDDCKVVFSGFCCFTSNPLRCVRYGDYGVNAYNIGKARKVLKNYDNQGYLNIMAVHAGIEHVNYPSIEHIRAARLLAGVCPYVYYGHHPHVIQGVEDYNGSLIAHSLGNFCFDDVYSDTSSDPLIRLSENNRTGIILVLEVEGKRVVSWKEQMIYIPQEGRMMLLDNYAQLQGYNESVSNCEQDIVAYNTLRDKIISDRLRERSAKRNLSWYFKRLRPRYVKILLNARSNKRMFNNNVLKYIQK